MEILATMTRGVQNVDTHNFVAIKETNSKEDARLLSVLKSKLESPKFDTVRCLSDIDEVLSDPESGDFDKKKRNSDADIFVKSPCSNIII